MSGSNPTSSAKMQSDSCIFFETNTVNIHIIYKFLKHETYNY